MERDHVGPGQQIVELDQVDLELLGGFGGEKRIVGEHPHPEAAAATGHLATDPAEAHDAEGLALELGPDERLPLPFPAADARVGGRHPSAQRQQQRPRVLGGGGRVGTRRVHDQDPAIGGGVDVDVVESHAGAADDPEPLGAIEELGVDRRPAADDQRVGVADRAHERVPLDAPRRENLDVGLGREALEAGLGERVGDQDAEAGDQRSSRKASIASVRVFISSTV